MSDGKMKVIFFGNNSLILDCLSKTTSIQCVFCQPLDLNNAIIVEMKKIIDGHSLPFYQPNKKMLYSYINYIENLNPDLIVVCGYKYIIPSEIFTLPKFGTINIHPSYLPKYRGQHVINWAIINGESETGVTIHFIDEKIDTGDIIVQKKVPIFFEDSASTLQDRIYREASYLLKNVINSISSGEKLQSKKQDNSNASYFRPRNPHDGLIDWSSDGIDVYNLIRAIAKPWPGAYTYLKEKKVILWNARFEACSHDFLSGTIHGVSGSNIIIDVNDGKLLVSEYLILDKNGNEINLEFKIGDKFTKESDGN